MAKELDQYTQKDLDDLINATPLSIQEQKYRLELQRLILREFHNIKIYYEEKGILEIIIRPLLDGELELMGHRIKITDSITNDELSKFLRVRVIAYELLK